MEETTPGPQYPAGFEALTTWHHVERLLAYSSLSIINIMEAHGNFDVFNDY
jgi:hypothetical protein